jgi:biofilm PGA synthesis N-glycosyltransferase PgaC
VEQTLRSVTEQTVKPVVWVIVDDGSTDATAQIVRRYVTKHPFIRLLVNGRAGARQPGAGVIQAFNHGYASVDNEDYDFVVKLDCDLSFEPDYFETLLAGFESDPQLGIASGVYLERDKAGCWEQVKMPSYHAFGACKMVRLSCFKQIGGFIAAKGWDTVDEIRAMAQGWKTSHFPALEAKHHKREGSGIGVLRTSKMHGEIYYATGGDPLFFMFKGLHRAATPPLLINALALAVGYGTALVTRKPMLVTRAEAQCYRKLLRQRLWTFAVSPFTRALHSSH